MGIWEIITLGLSVIVVPLIVRFFWYILTKERDRIERFNNASDEFRKIFNQAIVDIKGGRFGRLGFGTSPSDDVVKTHRVAYLNFRPHLRGEHRNQYDEAWNQYCNRGLFPQEEDINRLLEFTEYRLWRHITFIFRKYTKTKKTTPLSKEEMELIEKICNLHNNTNDKK